MRAVYGIMILGFILLAITATRAQSAPVPAATVDHNSSTTGEEIKSLERKLADMIVHADWTEYEKHLGADFTRIGDDGEFQNKEQLLSSFKAGTRKILVMEPEDLQVRSYGETAILQGQLTVWVREAGRVSSRHERFTEVFMMQQGELYLMAEQETPERK